MLKMISTKVALVTLLLADVAHAIRRTCNAYYLISLSGRHGDVDNPTVGVGHFQARRGCGSSVPDRCRRRARDSAHACMKAFWDSPHDMPSECSDAAILDFPETWEHLGPHEAIEIEGTVLSEFLNGFRSGDGKRSSAAVFAVTEGDTGCGKIVYLGQVLFGTHTKNRLETEHAVLELETFVRQYDERYLGHSKDNWHTQQFYQIAAATLSDGQQVASGSFAPLDRSNSVSLMHAQEEPYNGCARHAAQHMMDFLGYSYDVSAIGHYVDLYPGAYKFTKPNKATTPAQLERGLHGLLDEEREDKVGVKRMRQITVPQERIFDQVLYRGPVIGLVENGKHWATAMGFWCPVLEPYIKAGSFYTFSNGYTVLEDWSYFNLRFSDWMKTASYFLAKSYRQGTMIMLEPE